jgi:hypothetical protein
MGYETELFGDNGEGGRTKLKIGKSGMVPTMNNKTQKIHEDRLVIASYHDTDVDINTPLIML